MDAFDRRLSAQTARAQLLQRMRAEREKSGREQVPRGHKEGLASAVSQPRDIHAERGPPNAFQRAQSLCGAQQRGRLLSGAGSHRRPPPHAHA